MEELRQPPSDKYPREKMVASARKGAAALKAQRLALPEADRKAWGERMRVARERKAAERERVVEHGLGLGCELIGPHRQGDCTIPKGAEAPPVAGPGKPVPLVPPKSHFWHTLEGGFWFETAYRMLLDELEAKGKPAIWVEVGIFQGQSLSWLGVEVLNRGLDVTIHGVDPFYGWSGTPKGKDLERIFHQNTDEVGKLLGDRWQIHPVTSVQGSCLFRNGTVDVVWIDANHDYQPCRNDIAVWQPNVKPGGVIGGDDWNFEGVRQAVKGSGAFELVEGNNQGQPWPSWIRRIKED